MIFDDATPAGYDSVCRNCGFRSVTEQRICPDCGTLLKLASSERLLGGTMLFLGLVLAGIMALVIRAFYVVNAGKTVAVPGSVQFLIFLLFAAAGCTILSGGWQLFTAKRNKGLHYLALGMLAVAGLGGLIGAFIVRNFLS